MLNGELIGVRGLSGEIQREVITGGGGSGTSYYPDLNGLPQINGVELVGNKTSEELGLAGTDYVDAKVADLVNSAPETLDTLGEVAKALEENADVVDALNNAIGGKADKSELTDYVKNEELTELNNRVTALENEGVDLSNYYTKAETDNLFSNENLLRFSPYDVPEDTFVYDILDGNENNYYLGTVIGKTYVVEYIVEGVTYTKETEGFDGSLLGMSGCTVLGIKDGEPTLLFTTSDGNTCSLTIVDSPPQNENLPEEVKETGQSKIMINEIDMVTEYIPPITIVKVEEKGSKYALSDDTYTKDEIDTMVGDINTSLETILGV